jgi:hypothetical protein
MHCPRRRTGPSYHEFFSQRLDDGTTNFECPFVSQRCVGAAAAKKKHVKEEFCVLLDYG